MLSYKRILLYLGLSLLLSSTVYSEVSSSDNNVMAEAAKLPTLQKPTEQVVGTHKTIGDTDFDVIPDELNFKENKKSASKKLNEESEFDKTNDLDKNNKNNKNNSISKDNNDKKYVKHGRALNKFQEFIRDNTGISLPIYGERLFDNPNVYLLQNSGLASNDYKLVPGDEVRIQIWGGADYFATHTIDKNGLINLPKVGTANLAGIAVRDLENVLRKKFSSVFSNFNLAVSMGQISGVTVYVVGHAQNPGTHQLTNFSTLINGIFASGGPSSNGSMRKIQLKRANQLISTIDLYDFIAKGDKANDVTLQNGDVIYIPPVGHQVAVMGNFDFPAVYELKNDENKLLDIFQITGGLPKFIDVSKIILERIDINKTNPRQIAEIKLDKSGLATELKNGDVVSLLEMSQAFGDTITLQGKVAQPLRHRWFKGMRISDLIQEKEALISNDYFKRKNRLVQYLDLGRDAGADITHRFRNLVDEINWDYAVVERLNTKSLRTDLIPFSLELAIANKDPKHNILLQPGDVVTVLSQNDLRLPNEKRSRLVRLEGEVNSPGLYVIEAGESLPQFISRTGGLTAQAYLFGTEFKRKSVRQLQQKNLDELIQKLESQYQNDLNTVSQNTASSTSAAQSESLIKFQQQNIERKLSQVRALRSQGRVSLELSAEKHLDGTGLINADLPPLLLEDGDHIYVPSIPSFITAVGSVLNENALVYRHGKTVSDVLERSGLADDADLDGIFILRADGTILSKKSSRFFSSFSSTSLMPGDTVIVPAKWDRESTGNFIARSFKDWTQIFANFGLGIASLITIKKL